MVNASIADVCPRCSVQNYRLSLFCDSCRLYLRDETLHVERGTYNRRFWGDWVLEFLLFIATLIIGWFIWLIFTSKNGQTPAKSLLNVYVINVETGRRIGRGETWLREVVVKGLVLGAINSIIGVAWLIDAVWLFFDKDRQTLHDKVLKQVVVYAPAGLPQAMQYEPFAPPRYQAPPIIPAQTQGHVPGAASTHDVAEQLRELARLRDEGSLTAEEYEEKRARLAGQL